MERVLMCVVLSMLAASGCGGGTAETETETTVETEMEMETETETRTAVAQTETTPPPPAPVCDQSQLDSLGATLSGGLQVGAPVRGDIALPAGTAGQPASEPAPILIVADDAVTFAGTPVAGANDGAKARALGTAWTAQQNAPAFVYVATTGPIARVVALTARLPATVAVRLLVRPPPPATDHPAVAALRAQADPAARCTAAFAAMDQVLGSCTDAREAGHRLVGGSPACPAAPLAAGNTPAFVDQLRTCGCNGADLAAVSALIAFEQAESGANLRYLDLPRRRPTGAAARQTAADFVTASAAAAAPAAAAAAPAPAAAAAGPAPAAAPAR